MSLCIVSVFAALHSRECFDASGSALVFLVDPLEHFISVASARDELIFNFGLAFPQDFQGRHGTSDSVEVESEA